VLNELDVGVFDSEAGLLELDNEEDKELDAILVSQYGS